MIRIEQLLREAREQDHTCEFCYYELFDDKAYPCSRCVCNQPTENMWRPKIKDEPQTETSTNSEKLQLTQAETKNSNSAFEKTDCQWK